MWNEDSAYMELLAEQVSKEIYKIMAALYSILLTIYFIFFQSARLRERAENMEFGEESDFDDEDDVIEELSFMSPLDNVNPYTSFKQALTS